MKFNKFTQRTLANIRAALHTNGSNQAALLPFDNGGERVNFGHNDNFGIGCWFKTDSALLLSNSIATNRTNGNTGWELTTGNQTLNFAVHDGTSPTFFNASKLPSIVNNKWYHLYVNFIGGGAGPSTVEYYVNGFLFESVSAVVNDFQTTNSDLEIAANTQFTTYNTGQLAYLRFYNNNLNGNQVLWNVKSPGQLHPDAKAFCVLEYACQSDTIGGTYQFQQAVTSNGGAVTSLDNIPIGSNPLSICCFTNLDNYLTSNQNVLKGNIPGGLFEWTIAGEKPFLYMSNGSNTSHATSPGTPASTEPILRGMVNNRNNFCLINATTGSIVDGTNPWTYRINNTRGNCVVVASRDSFGASDASFAAPQIFNVPQPLNGSVLQMAIFVNDAGGTYALNKEQEDFVYNLGNGNDLLSDAARKLGIGVFGTDTIGVNGITTLLIRYWEVRNGEVVEKVNGSIFLLTGGAAVETVYNENRMLKETAFSYNKQKVSAQLAAPAVLLGYTDDQVGALHKAAETLKKNYYNGRPLADVGMRGDATTGVNKYVDFGAVTEVENSNTFTIIFTAYLRDIVQSPTEFFFVKNGVLEIRPDTISTGGPPGVSFWTTVGSFLRSSVLTANTLYRVAVTFTPTQKVIYINGQEDVSESGTFSTATNPAVFAALNFGSTFINGGLNSTLFDAHLFNAALTPAQIAADYQQSLDITTLASHVESWYFKENQGLIPGIKGTYDGTVVGYDTSISGHGLFETKEALLPPIREVYNMENAGAGTRQLRVDNYNTASQELTVICLVRKNADVNFDSGFDDTFFSKSELGNPNIYIAGFGQGNTKSLRTTNFNGAQAYWNTPLADLSPYLLSDYMVLAFTQSPTAARIYLNGVLVGEQTTPSGAPVYLTFADINGSVGTDGMYVLGDTGLASRSFQGRAAFYGQWASVLPTYVIQQISVDLIQGKISRFLDAKAYPEWTQQLLYNFGKGAFYESGGLLRLKNYARTAAGVLLNQFDAYPLGISGGSGTDQLNFIRQNLIEPISN